MKKVLILLSTYNGQQFLKEQLDSLYCQKDVIIHILVRDDGSSDDTIDILKSYKNKYGHMDILVESNVGVAKSFYRLIEKASADFCDYNYYAFADQDDVWFDEKIIWGINQLDISTNKYKLFFLNVTSTNSMLEPLQGHHIAFQNTFESNLISNHILGCTMLFNHALLNEINKINDPRFDLMNEQIPLHDGWTAITAYSLCGDVIKGETPLMYYRQHGDNVVGSNNNLFSLQYKRICRYLKTSSHRKEYRWKCALKVFDQQLPQSSKQLLIQASNYRTSFTNKLSFLLNRHIYTGGIADNIGVFFLILFNKF